MAWRTFVAVGDSLTEGVGDPVAGGSLRGWADLLADALALHEADFHYINLARRSLRTHEIREQQLPRALELQPDLASALVGMNDLTRADFDPGAFRLELGDIVSELSAAGATVLTASFPDVSRFLPVPERIRRPMHERLAAASDAVRAVAKDYGTVFVDVWHMPEVKSRNIISIDCMHPNARGHLLLARAFGEILSERAGIKLDFPVLPAGGILSRSTLLHVRWIATNAAPQALRFIRGVVTRRL